MSDDPRDFFRLPARNCGTCANWPAHFIDPPGTFCPKHESGAIELPCSIHRAAYQQSASNYENGWRRASDSCLDWSRRTTP